MNIIVENTNLESTSSIKVLGVNIDSKLNFNDHVCDMCTTAGRQLNVLQRLKSSLDYDSRMVIYKSFIISNFDYYPVVWLFTSKSSLAKLENIQKRALRYVLNDYESDYNDLLTKVNVPGIKIMTLRQLTIEVYTSVAKIDLEYLNELFLSKQCTYNLRNVSVLERPKVNTTQFGLKSFKSYGSKIWNLLPNSFKKDISLGELKNFIKSWNGPNRPVSQIGRHKAACCEPAGSYDKTTRTAVCFEHKTQYF